MNPEIKTKWLAALRSGEYEQGQGTLKKDDKFCCLGVLCDIHRIEKENSPWKGREYLEHHADLPLEVIKWAGLKRANPLIRNHSQPTLIHANDSNADFLEIADLIEEQL